MNQENNTGNDDFFAELKEMAAQSAAFTDNQLEAELNELMQCSGEQLEKLRPMVTDKESYDRLIRAVAEASANNETIGQLKDRLTKDGGGLLDMGLSALGMLKGL